MAIGLFGKLPAKRDFVAHNTPRRFLDGFEPWLQASVSASRHALGDQWADAFRQAPIWRFWLGADLCGGVVMGALMPSVDGVGRYFPLTLFSIEEQGQSFPPPELEPNDQWYDALEEHLLDALST